MPEPLVISELLPERSVEDTPDEGDDPVAPAPVEELPAPPEPPEVCATAMPPMARAPIAAAMVIAFMRGLLMRGPKATGLKFPCSVTCYLLYRIQNAP